MTSSSAFSFTAFSFTFSARVFQLQKRNSRNDNGNFKRMDISSNCEDIEDSVSELLFHRSNMYGQISTCSIPWEAMCRSLAQS